MKFLFKTLLLLIISYSAFGQENLSTEDLQRLQKNAEKKVISFEKLVSDIAMGKDDATKQIYIKTAYAMFEPNATIEVSNKTEKSETINKSPILKYLNSLSKLNKKYKIITITFKAGFVKIEKLKEKKDAEGNIYYEGSITIKQCFCSTNSLLAAEEIERRQFTSDCSAYGDCTSKKVKIIVKQVITIEGERWVVMLGDISIVETNAIK